MQITVCLVSCLLSEAAVRRAAVVMDIAVIFDYLRQQAFIDVTGGEICVAEVRMFIGVVQL